MHCCGTLKPHTPLSPEGTPKKVHLDNAEGTGGGIGKHEGTSETTPQYTRIGCSRVRIKIQSPGDPRILRSQESCPFPYAASCTST